MSLRKPCLHVYKRVMPTGIMQQSNPIAYAAQLRNKLWLLCENCFSKVLMLLKLHLNYLNYIYNLRLMTNVN